MDYLARAVPYATARFIRQNLDSIWRDIVHQGQEGDGAFVGGNERVA